jgi:hypothetical protein
MGRKTENAERRPVPPARFLCAAWVRWQPQMISVARRHVSIPVERQALAHDSIHLARNLILSRWSSAMSVSGSRSINEHWPTTTFR